MAFPTPVIISTLPACNENEKKLILLTSRRTVIRPRSGTDFRDKERKSATNRVDFVRVYGNSSTFARLFLLFIKFQYRMPRATRLKTQNARSLQIYFKPYSKHSVLVAYILPRLFFQFVLNRLPSTNFLHSIFTVLRLNQTVCYNVKSLGK